MPPRQKTTFKNKKPTTTYSYVEDRPTSASERLDTFIRSNPQGDNRNTQQSSVNEVVLDMPTKFQSKFKDVKNYGDMNSAQKMIFDFYDNRNKYQRDMNNLRTSSPEMKQAYAQKFPVSNFAMEMGPTIAGAMTGIPLGLLERGFDKTKKGFDFLKSGAGQGLDSLVSGIDKGMGAVESGLDFLTGKASDVKDDAVDIFKEATTKRQEPSTFTVQNMPGDLANFRGDDFLIDDVSRVDSKERIPVAFDKYGNLYNQGLESFDPQYMFDVPFDFFTKTGKTNFNQGGLASLNNQDYGMLMGASNFGF
jgi:hypothetical protein